ncbi:hypothetical protein ACWGIU_11435 [Streptomyces sp. NPDC054840]
MRNRLLTGGGTALLAFVTLGLANPALAATATEDAKPAAGDRCYGYYSDSGFVVAGDGDGDDCGDGRGEAGPRGPAGPPGPPGPPGPSLCDDIDTTDYFATSLEDLLIREELSAVLLTDERVLVGQRDLNLNGSAANAYVWDRIDDNTGFPQDSEPCAVSITTPSGGVSAVGDTAYVKVLFLSGEVWELPGVRTGILGTDTFDFSGGTWVEVTEPSLALKDLKNKKALKAAPKNAR